MMQSSQTIAITAGEPAGIGPDICLALATQPARPAIIFACPKMMALRADQLGQTLQLHVSTDCAQATCGDGHLTIYPIEGCHHTSLGSPSRKNAAYVLRTLAAATDACLDKRCAALLTAPVQKESLHTTDAPFIGHTEYFAHRTQTSDFLMLFATPRLLVGLASGHLPLSKVSQHLTETLLISKLQLLEDAVRSLAKTASPKIGVMGLNPHAGENGLLGEEEQQTIRPALAALLSRSKTCWSGPLSPDACFLPRPLNYFDAMMGMYHDQVLVALKALWPRECVNVTWGLPFLRASVDHGTALDIAGTGKADPSSLFVAFDFIGKHLT